LPDLLFLLNNQIHFIPFPMKKQVLLFLSFIAYAFTVFSSGDVHSSANRSEVRFIKNNKRQPDAAYQDYLRNKSEWQNFLKTNGTWYVIFNEENGRPHRAFGKPVPMPGFSAKERADNFISSKLGEFKIPVNELSFQSYLNSGNYEYVNYYQKHDGLSVLNSRLEVKMTLSGNVIMFAADVFDDINISTSPVLSSSEAIDKAKNGIVNTIVSTFVNPDLKILPVPDYKKNIYKLVYEVTVKTLNEDNIPASYYTLVDAETGEVIYRHNDVMHSNSVSANTDINVTATVYPSNPYNSSALKPLRNLKMVQGSTYYTDSLGYIGTPNSSSATATFYLQGTWSTVKTGSTIPTFTVTINPGSNSVSFDANANIRERSAYYHVNIIHDYMKTKYPSFTGMDISLPTNVDVSGTCNAFYNGSSINFYSTGGGCNSFAQVGDVVYHEYGHGINDKFYQANGGYFANGAMGEGYADIWAIGVTADPVLGIGNSSSDPNSYIRRYDINKKVYPKDLVGEVHADGEIIAGAWWDLNLNLGNLQQMMDLYSQTFYGLVTGYDGDEGQVFVDILIETLQDDDAVSNGGDGDITTGTPNDNAIIDAFALHGITLLSNVSILHTPVVASSAAAPVTINAALINLEYPWALGGVNVYYKLNRTGSWSTVTMTNTSSNNYSAVIPSQPAGTVIAYYLALQNTNGSLSGTKPVSADLADPNIPYFILNGFDTLQREDFDDVNMGSWLTGVSGDNATTGQWVIAAPAGTYYNSVSVQPASQHTPGGSVCAVTGNGSDPSALGQNDVDAGQTTLESPVLDLSSYTNPALSFYRWYTNNPPTSANPANDFWEVQISNNGSNWVKVERTNVSDASWRMFAFRISDYVSLSSTMKIRFVAEDSLIPSGYLSGGSLVEAAIDDITLFEEAAPTSVKKNDLTLFNIYPNPAKEQVFVNLNSAMPQSARLTLVNGLGQIVYDEKKDLRSGANNLVINTSSLPTGIYSVNIITEENIKQAKLTVIK
jgi:hypothetical protein